MYELIMLFWAMTPPGGESLWVNLGGGWWGGIIF